MRKINIPLYVAAFLITTLIFGAGVYIGIVIEQEAAKGIYSSIEESMQRITDAELILLLKESPSFCPVYEEELGKAFDETDALGQELEYLEKQKEVYDPELKSKYFALELRNYLMAEKVKEICGGNFSLVLYFYSRDCAECEEQGEELTKARGMSNGNLKVFSFDGSSESSIVNALKKEYYVSHYPTIIVNEEYKLTGFRTAEQIVEKVG
ncbi:MAG: hypothetical protein ACPL06_01585 [Candidatus Anstonellales archaeon]